MAATAPTAAEPSPVASAECAGSAELFAACPRGLEAALAAELSGLGATHCRAVAGGVLFAGDRRAAYAVNLWSRLASRVLRRVAQRRYRSDDDLYRLAAGVEWERCFDARHTLRVDLSAVRSPLRSLNFATLRIKDGIVDRLRERTGQRPSIDTRAPDARVFAYLEDRQATLYLDLSGEPLFKRGWRAGRDDKGEAPLKENLAAGLLTLAGWTPAIPLYDPFCGSGTIVIEAAQIAFDLAPGLSRAFGLEKLLDHDAALWASLRADAIRRAQAAGRALAGAGADTDVAPLLAGSDLDPHAIERARRNLERAGLPPQAIAFRAGDAAHARPPFERPGFIVTNPPYGERIAAGDATAGSHAPSGRDAAAGRNAAASRGTAADRRAATHRSAPSADPSRHEQAMRAFGEALRSSFAGWQAWLLSSDRDLPAQLGMKERRRTPLYNGAIECRLYGFEIFGRAARVALNENDAGPPAPSMPDTPSRRQAPPRRTGRPS
ncbi:MAG: class I SAM-dependent RNA methyltransferase [Burkholderiales bacterium]|nr:class I SAM-dependent RNA methyltransferase [Burkholderiales bacterium]